MTTEKYHVCSEYTLVGRDLDNVHRVVTTGGTHALTAVRTRHYTSADLAEYAETARRHGPAIDSVVTVEADPWAFASRATYRDSYRDTPGPMRVIDVVPAARHTGIATTPTEVVDWVVIVEPIVAPASSLGG